MSHPTALSVRALRAQDEGMWRPLWTAYLAFYGTSVPDDVMTTTFGRLVAPEETAMQAFVAERDGALLGLVHLILHQHCWRIEPVCYLQDLFAAPQARGKGVGRALIEAAYGWADDVGAPTVYWLTQSDNTQARHLYDRIGTQTDFIKYQRP